MDLEQAEARIAELEGQVKTTTTERDGAAAERDTARGQLEQLTGKVGELEPAVTALRSEAETARTAAGQAQAESLANLRRAILAEHAGKVVPELVVGDTAEQLQTSVESARAAFSRATEAARAQLQAERVPAGAPTRDAGAALAIDQLSPSQKIAEGLKARS